MESCPSELERRGCSLSWGEDSGAEWSKLKGLLDDDAWFGVRLDVTIGEGKLYRLWAGVMNFCGVRLIDLDGVKACWNFCLLLGVLRMFAFSPS